MRLFAAVDLEDAARANIAAEQRRLRTAFGDTGSLRWVQPSHMHLTLVFLGEVGERTAADVVHAMRPAIEMPPFRLTFGGLGLFPPRGAPRVLWLGAVSGAEQAVALQAIVAARMAECGIPPEGRPFRPHLTLARWRDGRRPKGLRGAGGHSRGAGAAELDERLAQGFASHETAAIDVREVTLFRSELSSQGPVYTVLACTPLAGQSAPRA